MKTVYKGPNRWQSSQVGNTVKREIPLHLSVIFRFTCFPPLHSFYIPFTSSPLPPPSFSPLFFFSSWLSQIQLRKLSSSYCLIFVIMMWAQKSLLALPIVFCYVGGLGEPLGVPVPNNQCAISPFCPFPLPSILLSSPLYPFSSPFLSFSCHKAPLKPDRRYGEHFKLP